MFKGIDSIQTNNGAYNLILLAKATATELPANRMGKRLPYKEDMTSPLEFLLTTPIPASPVFVKTTPSKFVLWQPTSGGFHLTHFLGFDTHAWC